MMQPHRGPRALLLAVAVVLGVTPVIADMNPSHVFNPSWPGHARLHMVWLLGTHVLLCATAVWLLVAGSAAAAKDRARSAAWLLACALGGFFIAAATKGSYGGTLADEETQNLLVLGLNANLAAFSMHAVLISIAMVWLHRAKSA